jgi:hypothetical protein
MDGSRLIVWRLLEPVFQSAVTERLLKFQATLHSGTQVIPPPSRCSPSGRMPLCSSREDQPQLPFARPLRRS